MGQTLFTGSAAVFATVAAASVLGPALHASIPLNVATRRAGVGSQGTTRTIIEFDGTPLASTTKSM